MRLGPRDAEETPERQVQMEAEIGAESTAGRDTQGAGRNAEKIARRAVTRDAELSAEWVTEYNVVRALQNIH